jgi:hypothetical protein
MCLLSRTPVFGCILAVLVLAGALGCTMSKKAVPMVKVQAAKDLNCPQKNIKVTRELGGRYRATGCKRSAVYHSACEHLECSVGKEDETPMPWRDRPEPGSVEEWR